MTKEEVNKTIHEIRGLATASLASKPSDPDYHTSEGFFTCWDWAKEQEWWNAFISHIMCIEMFSGFSQNRGTLLVCNVFSEFINPTTFAPILAEWLVKEKIPTLKKVYRTNVDTVSLNVEHFPPHDE